ncbi:translocase [Mangrovibacter phragmitis]|uniref:Bactoprenol-linked glucose translocase n=1 Tax=Mangrovibacter phragmitis TaxID=1691903 RepID=A0A1B7L926_9ENTR|nr:GtrA family protein [Mangrovibacter phragmitis]OAT78826.1 translocase [Mangrovibacter phragmitis]
MIKLFARYFSVGLLNTMIHWAFFSTLFFFFDFKQAYANLIAFCVAVTFSFFMNARWTFKSRTSLARYAAFVVFMGGLAALTGHIADKLHLPGVITLVVFSAISLITGFVYSKFIIFRN